MLLEAILRRIYNYSGDSDYPHIKVGALLNVLIDAMPDNCDKPMRIETNFVKDSGSYSFFFKDKKKNTVMNYWELYQYFTTVLGEEK